MGVGLNVRYLYGYKIASYYGDHTDYNSIVEEFLIEHFTKIGYKFKRDEDGLVIRDINTKEWLSFEGNDIAEELVLEGGYRIQNIGDNGNYDSYFIVLKEMLIDPGDTDKECFSPDDVATSQQIKEFRRFLHEDLEIPLADIKANCNFYVVPEIA